MRIIENALMKNYTTFKTGGPADALVFVDNTEELKEALNMKRPLLLGNGSNTLFMDKGYRGTVIKLGEGFSYIRREGNKIVAGAAALLPAVSRFAEDNSLTGLEFACGIPASVGGAMYMNAGAYDHTVSELLENSEGFGYRKSPFMENGGIVTEAVFSLKEGDREEISQKMKELTKLRTSKQPLAFPSAGSFFKRPEGHFAGKLIQDAGLKGYRVGGAQVSDLHAGFIINRGNATTTDILNLMDFVQNEVLKKFGVILLPEVRIIEE